MKPMELKEARLLRRKTLAELASQVDCAKSTLSRLERGLCRPMLHTAERLEKALGVKLRFDAKRPQAAA